MATSSQVLSARSFRRTGSLAPLALLLVAGCAVSEHQRQTAAPAAAAPAPTAATSPAPAPATAATTTPSTLASAAKPKWKAIFNGEEVSIDAALDAAMGDPATIQKIIHEGKNRNQVMSHIRYLTGQIGPRLTGSSRIDQASEWIMSQYRSWGLTNVHTEQWGTIATRFDRGPSTGKVYYTATRPPRAGRTNRESAPSDPKPETAADAAKPELARELQFTTLAWTAGTNGPAKGPVVRMPKTEEEYQAIKPKLKGAWVLLEAQPAIGARGVRNRATAIMEARIEARAQVAEGKKKIEDLPIRERMIFDGVLGWIATSRDERVWTGGINGWRDRKLSDIPPDVHVSIRLSDYDFINSRLADGEGIEVEFDLQHKLTAGPIPVYNTMAEIRGTEKPEEIVIISAHLDSWDGPGSQGTTDNGTGTVDTLEAARILAAVGAKPKRTIRFVHWTGEEQGLLGSEGYVQSRKADGTLDNTIAVFVDDGGTNSNGGFPCLESMAPMLLAATAPANGLFFDAVSGKPLNVNVRTAKSMPKGGASDHASFNAVGIPGFYWDEVGRADYPYGWHTQHDKVDLAIPEYLMQSATVSAITAYRLACAPDRLPRATPESAEPAKKEPAAASNPPASPAPTPTTDTAKPASGTP